MAQLTDADEMVTRLERCSHVMDHSSGVTAWELCPNLGLAWRSPIGVGTAAFIYQEVRSRFVRRVPRLGFLPSIGSSIVGRLGASALARQRVSAPELGAGDVVVTFGERRTRVLDFTRRVATAIDRDGYQTVAQEIEARSIGDPKFATTILDYAISDGVVVERLERGFNLAIYGHAYRRANLVAETLDNWRRGTVRSVTGAAYASQVEQESPRVKEATEWHALARQLSNLEAVSVAASHGDLQPSNVVMSATGVALLLDFEHFGVRWSGYDMEVFSSGLRWTGEPRQDSVLLRTEELRFRADRGESLAEPLFGR